MVFYAYGQKRLPLVYNKIGINSTPADAPIKMTLFKRFQHRTSKTSDPNDVYDTDIYSPKSATYLASKQKLYIQSLEGYETIVYDMNTFRKIKVIRHTFKAGQQPLFGDKHTVFDYTYKRRKSNFNIFSGKPVESCLSHKGKYLWVTYYRRSYDANAESPSAVAIIDTDSDEIVRVMPTGPLPKMIAASPDNKYIAVTHWGDNTIGLIDIDSEDINDFKYVKHFVVDYRVTLDFGGKKKVNRDNNCGYCLRGTVFTPDSKYLLVGRMGGGGIATFDMESKTYLGTTFGMKTNLRHLLIRDGYIYISTNSTGYVQKAVLADFLTKRLNTSKKNNRFEAWESCSVGRGARTIVVSNSGKYIFACVNSGSKIVAIDAKTMKIVATVPADSFPVGMAITDDDRYLVITSQGRSYGGGHSVMIYRLAFTEK